MNQRLISLDVLRGLTVFLMVLVNNGVGDNQFVQLTHSRWNGLTLCDLVFPFFLFMVGVSIWLSRNRLTPQRILQRTIRLFLMGLWLHVWEMLLSGQWWFLPDLRFWGVLQRIALCYGVCAILVLWGDARRLWIPVVVLLMGYAALLHFGRGYLQDESNYLAVADRTLFGAAHLYRKSPIDPEGLLSTLPAIAHTLLGVLVGWLLNRRLALSRLVLLGTILTLSGFVLSLWLPLNKRIWSPSFVLVTCGLATLLLSWLVRVVDVDGQHRWCRLFQMFGLNAFFLYVLSEMLSPVFSHLGVNIFLFRQFSLLLPAPFASLAYALCFVGLIALVAWQLWSRKLFFKI